MRKTVADNSNSDNIDIWGKGLNVGDTLEGTYVERKDFQSKFDNKTSHCYILKDNGGSLHGVFSTAVIDRTFNEIPLNSYVWIEYKGATTTKAGGTVKLFKIDYDDEYQG